eukprot:Hpha_TRINITY_DN6399_c0_g1::TRINITY_DN6399_c0_g1_i1::g.145495::m.145495
MDCCVDSTPAIDVIVPVGPRDTDGVARSITSLRAHVCGVRRVVLVVPDNITVPGADAVLESAVLGREERVLPSWLRQQVLKLKAPLAFPGLSRHVLVADADLVWLECTQLFTVDGRPRVPRGAGFDVVSYQEPGVRLALPGLRAAALPRGAGLLSGVAHHMLLDTVLLARLPRDLGASEGLASTLAAAARVRSPLRVSEYQTYFIGALVAD